MRLRAVLAFIATFTNSPEHMPMLAMHRGEPSMLAEPASRFALAIIAGALLAAGILFCWAQMGRIRPLVKWGSLAVGATIIPLTVLLF